MKDVQELFFQSMMANEGTLRAIQEQQEQMQDPRQQKNNGKEERQRRDRNMTSEVDGNLDATANDAVTISKNEASALVADEGDKHEETNNRSDHTTTIPLLYKLHDYWSSMSKSTSDITSDESATATSSKLVVATTSLSSQIQKLRSNLYKYSSCMKVPRKIMLLPGGNNDDGEKWTTVEVDVPSVILGASVTGIAWIVVTFAAPSRSNDS